ncbi:hypothetical protein QOZ84_03790 [Romboutsia sedimentorum]|uniref:Uncharacterized protein n=1 Tax=Romboutsia sedimentorum TaxID=1368474 RepID=A0ABT7EAY0_9FIRM|nr:hypothetical protein [Romboutsia sedimentorum]MDK2562660.1 hypothetical protein [Romboutsia sedimentorum]
MAKILRSKYNSTGERCVDACLNYGELRYVNEDGSPISIEIPCDKYEEAASDFEDRIREGITQSAIEPKEILKRGSLTYAQAKNLANEGRIKGLDFFEIDGSVECDHILGISGSVEYALSVWNGESKNESLVKALVRAIKVYGEEFINGLDLDNTVDLTSYTRFAKNLYTTGSIVDINLYKVKNYHIDNEIHIDGLDLKEKSIKNIDLPLGIAGAFLGFIIVQICTNYGEIINNRIISVLLNSIVMIAFGLIVIKSSRYLTDKYVKNNTQIIMEMFNEELEKASYDNLLTEKEACIILKNITKGEVSRLLLDMKGSVNKKVSSSNIVTKETKFILDARRIVILPSEYEIKESLNRLVEAYQDKLSNEYNVNNI